MGVVNFRSEQSNDGGCLRAAGKNSEEEGNSDFLFSSSSMLRGRFGQLYLNTQVQSVCSWCEVSDVISFRLGQVITPSWLCSEVVVGSACKLTTTSMLPASVCAGVGAQLLLVASSSVDVWSGILKLLLISVGLLQQLLGCWLL